MSEVASKVEPDHAPAWVLILRVFRLGPEEARCFWLRELFSAGFLNVCNRGPEGEALDDEQPLLLTVSADSAFELFVSGHSICPLADVPIARSLRCTDLLWFCVDMFKARLCVDVG